MNHYLSGNRLRLLRNGAEYFPALELAIDSARHEIHLETYIFSLDASGERIANALKRAAQRGIAVYVLIDGFGSKDLSKTIVVDMERAGVCVYRYRPKISPWSLKRHRLRRLHRKLAVIDNRISFVGGINIIDDMHTPHHKPPRFDFAVAIEGPLVALVSLVVKRLWTLVRWTNLKRRENAPQYPSVEVPAEIGGQVAAFVIRDNFRHRNDIEEEYLEAIAQAKKEILIANAYFLPGKTFRRALIDAAERGVRVILLLQGQVEYVFLHYASQALYGQLLNHNIEIILYEKSFLHAKVAVIDSHWATVGSSNIDPFSLLLAREANVFVRDMVFAGELRQNLMIAIADGGKKIERDGWKRKPIPQRFIIWVSFGLVRFLMGMLGYGGDVTDKDG